LGCDYWRDAGLYFMLSTKTVHQDGRNLSDYLERSHSHGLRSLPMEPHTHPELDTSEFCNENEKETKIYQSLIGAVQWATSF